jgi:LPS-assembly protein
MKAVQNSLLVLCGGLLLSTNTNAAELGGEYKTLLCTENLNIPDRPFVDAELEPGDTHMVADEADLVDGGVSTLTGNAEVTRDAQQVTADVIHYNDPADTADLDGNVNYWDESLYLKSNEAFLELDKDTGEFIDADFVIKESRARGIADKMVLEVGKRSVLEETEYTTCDPNDEFWKLSADKIELNHETNYGTGRNVVLKIKDFPVFYTPYMSFPLSDERKSGFLTPSYGTTTSYGLQITTPYYWNISPNMDATITPRFFSDSGVMAIGEFRFLHKRGSGVLGLEYLPSDNQFNDKNRNLLAVDLAHSFKNGLSLSIDYNRASDKFYFEDFGSQLSTTSVSFLRQTGQVRYAKAGWNIRALIQSFQITNPSIPDTSKPYKRLPNLFIDYASPNENHRLNYGIRSQFAYFYRDTGVTNDFNAFRADLNPYISFPMTNVYSFIKPKLSLRYTQYELDGNPSFDSSSSRIIPTFSLDSGLFFERDVSLLNRNYLQTLEPRLFYLLTPKQGQDDLPRLDSGLYTLSYNTLFYENRFSSVDRVADANQITAAMTSRFIDKNSGRSLGTISIGQIFYFRDREINFPGQTVRDEQTSSLVASFGTTAIKHLNINSEFQWNPYVSDSTEKLTFQARYNPAPRKVLNLSYRVVRSNEINRVTGRNSLGVATSDIDQSDISFSWPITKNWSAVGRWNYAVPEGRSLETFAGIEYESCCWGARMVARRFLSNVNGDFENGLFLQFELKGLAGIGKKTVDFLKQQIPGYESEF